MTTRASTVIRSMPTSEILTHASTTMPLSRIRSSTSIRLLPPGARSTAMVLPAFPLLGSCRNLTTIHLPLEVREAFLQPFIFGRGDRGPLARIETIGAPPVDSDGLGLVDRADHQAQLNRQQLDVRQRDFDVAGHNQTLV